MAAIAAIEDSLNVGVMASAIASWLYEILKRQVPAKARNELTDAKNMLMGLATGSTLDAVAVSRSRKTINKNKEIPLPIPHCQKALSL